VEKLIVYVDGFNLYYGLHDLARCKLLWLDLVALSRSLRRRSRLVQVKYFTAPVLDDRGAAKRQGVYQTALEAQNPGAITIIQGRYQRKTVTCLRCGRVRTTYEEKETDVNIAATLVADAALGDMDAAIVISGDSDLVPGIQAARRVAPGLFIAAAFPPKRYSAELEALMPRSFHIARAKIRQAQLPAAVVDAKTGHEYKRPAKWT
jgi:uncharacterized LabA/DUF88 family protein